LEKTENIDNKENKIPNTPHPVAKQRTWLPVEKKHIQIPFYILTEGFIPKAE
jgi:hypothetical protein